jgi:tetratricopeptide (TPR) repeat protein
MNRPGPSLPRWCLAYLLAVAPAAHADGLAEAQRLQAAGETAAALQRVERALTDKPKDAQLRFLRGVLLAENRRNAEAIEILQGLTQDYPDLPEPYNNLAALYAAAGDYDRARVALEQSLRANPEFATAHENLGDVLLMLASRSYARAVRLDPANASVPPKLASVRQLLAPRGGASGAAAAR